ncbi:MAG: type II toxin-antitoxin system HicA family toxin [Verrucomicrobia bacterium]|nr:type II toxin-antitoxin system HicA family toxin [Verrucomicrobiota bacterium]MDA7511229.1 type II toxin-antitoxin system HicA family toxin [Verrucomicrobiota bacterium]
MGNLNCSLDQILEGANDTNVSFDDLCGLLQRLGFEKRTKGSHHVFRKAGIHDMPNLQRAGKNANPYQVRQVREIVLKHKLRPP